AVCVYHAFVPIAVQALAGSGIPVAAVSTGFPAGLNPLPQRIDEIKASAAAGADEIDVVITRAHALAGRWEALYDEIRAFRAAWRSLAPRRPGPPRRVGAAHRHRAPARALRDGAVLGGAPPSDGMTTVSELFETMAYGPAPESDKPALEWIAHHGSDFALFVGGQWTKGKNGDGFDVINPATTAKLARVTQAGPADVDAAVGGAGTALAGGSGLSGHARARHLYALAREVQKQARLLAVLESL